MTEPATPAAEWTLRDKASLARGRALLRYADAVLFNVDEPPDGGRLPTAALLLKEAVEELTSAVDPGAREPAATHAFWVSLCAERSLEPTQWSALFSKPGRLALTRAVVLDLRRAAWAGVARLEPTNPATVVRWLKVTGVVALVLVLAVLGYQLSRPAPVEPGLLAGKPFRLSSKLGHDPGNPKLLFHTDRELSAWIEYDLQQPTQVKEVSVENRSDCCGEAALPLVLEASDDQATWRELSRRTEPFSRAVFSFPPVQTRYLRLRVGRMSYLHLEAVGAR